MCGITGFLTLSPETPDQSLNILRRMSDSLIHRGPDAGGVWLSPEGNIAFAHRRLAIVDLSEAGQQPMESQRYSLVFNGEIYNFRHIKTKLIELGRHFRGHSDTEVLINSLEQWGLDETLLRLEGMFAFAAYDKQDKHIFLARDRMGEKPLYYSQQRGHFVFSSELKAFKNYPHWVGKIDHNGLGLYFKHNTIPAPHTIYQNTFKLKPACYLKVDPDTLNFDEVNYWSIKETFLDGSRSPFTGTPQAAATKLEELLQSSIQDQMLADVPLGAFLSGGIDSSVVTSVMQSLSKTPINTYSIGFNFHDFNEAEHAKAIAKHLGTSHTEFYVGEEDAKNVIPNLHEIYDEPFADSSQIPTYLVCKLAKQHVTVALSGDGGDELFAGYSRYASTLNNWQRKSTTQGKLSDATLNALASLPPPLVDTLLSPLLGIKGKYNQHISLRLRSKSWVQQSKHLPEYYQRSIEFWHENANLLQYAHSTDYALNAPYLNDLALSPLTKLQYLDTQMYLPDDILTKVDRASMAVSLETRVPLLNHKIVEFAATLPDSIKTCDNKAKWPLQEVLSKYVPRPLFERPKQGFAIPIGEWLKGPLNSWMMDLLNENTIKQQGLFNYQAIKPIINMHMDGNGDYSLMLWSLLMFQAWHDSPTSSL